MDQKDWCVAIIGMNATGKSNFGKTLSAKLRLKRIDTDNAFTKKHGGIDSFITQNGIDAFRHAEAKLVLSSLKPGHLLVLSGGAIETKEIRIALKKKAAVIWLKSGKKRIVKNIRAAKRQRHEFAERSIEEAASDLLKIRNPLYEEVASIIIDENVKYSEYLSTATTQLQKFYDSTA